jgi:hypothetical protein
MLTAIRHFMETGEVAELDPAIPYDRVDGAEATIPAAAPWESVGAFAGEPVPKLARPVSARGWPPERRERDPGRSGGRQGRIAPPRAEG